MTGSLTGRAVKKRGASRKRKKGLEQDDAPKLFKQLRVRMYARALRYEDAPVDQRERLISITMSQYGEWEGIAREARRTYAAGHITAEEFLRRIDTTRKLRIHETVKQELLPEETVWQKRVAGNPDFDPVREYSATMMILG